MRGEQPRGAHRPATAIWLAVGLLVAVVVLAGAWLLDRSESGAAPEQAVGRGSGGAGRVLDAPQPRDPQAGNGAQVARPAPSQVDAQRPRSITLPSGTTAAVDDVATSADGELGIPSDVDRAGWWNGSARLGDPFGSIVLAAHVDSFDQGLGRFAELLSVRSGDHVMLATRNLQQEFRVVSAELVPKSALSRTSSIYAVTGAPSLVLLTCGGAYDPGTGYEDNLVVEAVPAGPLQGS